MLSTNTFSERSPIVATESMHGWLENGAIRKMSEMGWAKIPKSGEKVLKPSTRWLWENFTSKHPNRFTKHHNNKYKSHNALPLLN
jgi:hypothetical protein